MNIYISMPEGDSNDTFITPRSLEKLQEQGSVSRNGTGRQLTAEELVEFAKDADVIVCGWTTVEFTKELVEKLPKLKIIAYTGGSMDGVIGEGALDNGVVALTGNYIFAQSVAEGCLAYILCALRNLERFMRQVREGGWNEDWANRGLFGKKIGLIGFGAVAKSFVKLLNPFDVEILVNADHLTKEEAHSYGVVKASREEIFSTCDIVSVHLAANEKNNGCIDKSLLSLLRRDALFVNTARGSIVNEDELVELLVQKRFSAALDVFVHEPIAEDSPLRSLENVVVIPHMGGPTIDMREYIVFSFAKDLASFKKNEPMKNQFFAKDLFHASK